jgi:K+-sensing histidine kinase KdpD
LRFDEAAASSTDRPSERAKTLSAAPRSLQRHVFLAEASELLFATLDVRATARALAGVCVPALGDEAIVDLLERDGKVRRFVATSDFVSEDPAPVEGETSTHEEVIASGRTSILPGAIHAPLDAGGRAIGLLSVFGGADRKWGDVERSLVEELARRGAVALDHALQAEALRETLKKRDEAIAVVAHDLKTPLKTMQITAMRLLRELDGAPHASRKLADHLRRIADRLRHQVNDLLDLETIETGAIRLQKRHHDPAELLGEALEVLRPIALEKGLKLEAAVHHHRAVPCDRDRFVQVLTSMIGSALRLAPASASVSVSIEPAGRDALFRVTDGGGIPRDDVDRVFDRAWRSPAREPIGLTLAVARGIVEAHGGRVWIESEETSVTMCFTVPLGESQRPPPTSSM